MTNLNNLVTSLELSKRLKELGVPQDSLFWWYRAPQNAMMLGTGVDMMTNGVQMSKTTAPLYENYSAYTAGELGEMLKNSNWQLPDYDGVEWGSGIFRANTEADARADLLIHLLTSNLINVKG